MAKRSATKEKAAADDRFTDAQRAASKEHGMPPDHFDPLGRQMQFPDTSPVVYKWVGARNEDGTPLSFFYGLPARDLTENDLRVHALTEPEIDEDGEPTGERIDVTRKTIEQLAGIYEKAKSRD